MMVYKGREQGIGVMINTFSTFVELHYICVAKYRNIVFIVSPIHGSLLFTSLLPSNPIHHQLSQRKCLFISLNILFHSFCISD